MEAQRLNLLFTNYSQNDELFYQTTNESISYKDFILRVNSIAHQLKLTSNDFFAIKVNDPFLVFCYVLAAGLVQKKLLLLSPLESSEFSLKHFDNIPFQEIIEDEHPIHSQFTNAEEMFFIKEYFDEPFLFLLSSGSSGFPKGIGHSLLSLIESATKIVHELGMQKGEITYLNLPVHHVGGLMIFWRSFISQGIVSKLSDKYDYASFVPLQLDRMLKDEKSLAVLTKTKALLIGGSKLSTELKEKSTGHGIKIFETYGMTETASAVLLNGKPIPGQNVKIENDHILIKGPTLAKAIYQNQKLIPLPLDKDGYFVTSDRGTQIDKNHFEFVERLDLNFKSGAELINPLIIEQCVKELPWIKEAIVTSVPHPEWTQASFLLYESIPENKMGLDEEKEYIKKYLKSKLHPYFVPKYISHYIFSDSGLKPARYKCKEMARKLQSLEFIEHNFVESKKETKNLTVFIHGFLGDKTDMEEWAQKLSDIHSSFLFLSLPGHGKTEIKNFIDREDILVRLSDVISFYQQNYPLYLYGYSMGGRVALELAISHLKVTKLILESAGLGLETDSEKEKRLMADQSLFNNFTTIDTFLENWYSAPLFGNYNKTTRYQSDLQKKSLHNYPEWAKAIDFLSPGRDSLLVDNLKAIEEKKINITLITGPEDVKYFTHYQRVNSELQCPLYVIRDAAHNPHKTHPLEIQTIMLDLLENTPD